ncbi:MAG: hypothetical protein V3W37_08960 [Candidatus Binatia bacterium]
MRPTTKTFAKPAKIPAERAEALASNLSGDEFVLYTGGAYSRRRASGRSASLATITEVKKPVALSTYVSRALTAGPNGTGYDTAISVGGLSLHQGAKPAVYLYLVKDADGNYRAKKDIPNPDRTFSEKPFEGGDIVIAAPKKGKGSKAVATV